MTEEEKQSYLIVVTEIVRQVTPQLDNRDLQASFDTVMKHADGPSNYIKPHYLGFAGEILELIQSRTEKLERFNDIVQFVRQTDAIDLTAEAIREKMIFANK